MGGWRGKQPPLGAPAFPVQPAWAAFTPCPVLLAQAPQLRARVPAHCLQYSLSSSHGTLSRCLLSDVLLSSQSRDAGSGPHRLGAHLSTDCLSLTDVRTRRHLFPVWEAPALCGSGLFYSDVHCPQFDLGLAFVVRIGEGNPYCLLG